MPPSVTNDRLPRLFCRCTFCCCALAAGNVVDRRGVVGTVFNADERGRSFGFGGATSSTATESPGVPAAASVPGMERVQVTVTMSSLRLEESSAL